MTSPDSTEVRGAESRQTNYSRRWLVLALIGAAQLMVVLDATIVNIALPDAQKDLAFSDGSRQWIITAYALAFGSLLLIGGRIGDYFGRKPVFIAGLAGFAVASAAGGVANDFGVLVAARAAQGAFGALLAPAGLSLLTTTFTDPDERGKAFGIYGAIAGGGGAIGLLLGGALTETLDWRWCLWVNLVIAVPVILAAVSLLIHERATERPKLDIPGTLAATIGLFALVYGFSNAESDGWGSALTIGSLVVGVALLIAFVLIQRSSKNPLLPLSIVLHRNRGGAFTAMALSGAGIFGVFLFLTYYLQQTLAYSPITTGLAFMPMIVVLIIASGLANTKLITMFGPRVLVTTGMAISALGMVYFTRLEVDSSYAVSVLPGLLVLGAGMGLIFAPAMSMATLGVEAENAGVASAMVNTAQQVGGSLGTALLNTLFASAITSYLADNAAQAKTAAGQALATMDGYHTAFWWSAGIFAVGAVVSVLLFSPGVPEIDPAAEPVFAH